MSGDARRSRIARELPWLSALSLLGLVCLALGLSRPLLHVEKGMFWDHDYSVLSATAKLASDGDLLLAALVFLFVVLLPCSRLLGLALVGLRRPGAARRARSLHLLDLLDKWAMADVFVLAIGVVSVKLAERTDLELRAGAWFLLAGVAASSLTAWRVHRMAESRGDRREPPGAIRP